MKGFNSLPTFWWLWLIIAVVGSGLVYELFYGRKIATRKRLLVSYVFFIMMATVLGRKPGIARAKFIPFWSYSYPALWMEIILNYILFIPLGLLLYLYFGKRKGLKVVLFGFLLSSSIEIIQLVFKIGLFEFDDIIGNTIGCLIGAVVGRAVLKICNKEL